MAGSESLFGSDNLPNIARVEPTAAFAEARLSVSCEQIRRMADLSAPADSKVCFEMPENPAPRNLRPFCEGRDGFDFKVVKPQNPKCDGRRSKDGPAVPIHAVPLVFERRPSKYDMPPGT